MNQFLLTFENKHLEQSYQEERKLIVTTPLMKVILFFSFVYCIIDVILAILYRDYFLITIKLLLLGMIMIDILILFYKQSLIRIALVLSNIIIMVHQLDIDYKCDNSRAYIYGSNLMIIHLLLINESDFISALVQIISLHLIRIGIALNYTYLPVQPHIFTILLSLLIIYNCYQKESQTRKRYLLYIKDIQYGKLILKLLKEPFFISTFDKEKLKFKPILTNTVGGAYENFLCKAKVDNQSINNYIYNNMKQDLNKDDFVQKYFIAYYFDKKYEIQLSEYFLDQPVFQIVVQTVNERESKLIASFNKQYDRYLEFLKMITTMIQKYKRRRQHSQLQKLQYSMIEYYSYQRTKYRELIIKEVDLYIFLRNTFRQFYMNNLNNRHPYQIQRDQNVIIESDKQILNIFSCLILRNVILLDTVKLTNIKNCVQVAILGDYNVKIDKDKSLQYLYKQGLISDYFFGQQIQIYMITKRLGHY